MEIRERKHGAVTVIRPLGPLTEPDAEELLLRMLDVRERSLGRMVLDASDVLYVDSHGLEVLVEVGDDIIIASYALCDVDEAKAFEPSIAVLNDQNKVIKKV